MRATMHIRRFNRIQRLSHLFLVVTFLIQSGTGFGRLYITTDFGRSLCRLFGGYEAAIVIHFWVGVAMMAGFGGHILYLLKRIDRKDPVKSIMGPDSLVPGPQDGQHMFQRILWTFGLGSHPKLDRWAYWEKFDYWAVFWGLPLLAVTGVMLRFPVWTSIILPGWVLNIAALLHRAEAILAASFIFIVHFFIGHIRPTSFPMNEAMFSGSVHLEEAIHEKPLWVERLKKDGKFEQQKAKPPALWYRVLYYIFGYTALGFGLYILVNGIIYGRYIELH
jgi:cytochrome b subunit of formate dehydrogenase